MLENCSETRLVMSKLVGWSCEQKSMEVRREAAAAIQALFALNPAQVFYTLRMLLLALSSFQLRSMTCQKLSKTVLQKSFGSNLLSLNRHFLLVNLLHCHQRAHQTASRMSERVATDHLDQITTVGRQSDIQLRRELQLELLQLHHR